MKTPVTHDQMIRMLDLQQQSILQYQKDMTSAINARTISEIDRVAEKMDTMIKRQDIANGTMRENKKTTDKVNRISNNVKWYMLGLFGFSYVVCFIYDRVDLIQLFTLIFKKI